MAEVGSLNISFKTDVATLINDMRRASKSVSDASNRMDRSLQVASRSVRRLGTGILSLVSIRGVGRLSDQFTDLTNRIKVVTDTQIEFESGLAGVGRVARETQSTLAGTVGLYSRLTIASRDLDLTQRQVLDITKAVNQTFRISGASAQETAAASIQLAQGLASGALRGDELRSVLENNAVLGNLLAKELKTNVGALRDMAAEGKLTADVVGNILLKNLDDLNEQAKDIAPTFSKSFSLIKDQFSLGFSSKANDDLQLLSKDIADAGNRAFQFGQLLGDVVDNILYLGREASQVAGSLSQFFIGFEDFAFLVKSAFNGVKVVILTARLAVEIFAERIFSLIDRIRIDIQTLLSGVANTYSKIAYQLGLVNEVSTIEIDVRSPKELENLRKKIHETTYELQQLGLEQRNLQRRQFGIDVPKGRILSDAPFGPDAERRDTIKPVSGSSSDKRDKEAEKIARVIDQLKFENQQIVRNRREQDLYNRLRSAGVALDSQSGQKIKELLDIQGALQKAQRVSALEANIYAGQAIALADKYKDKLDQQADAFRQLDNIITRSIQGQIKSWKDLGDVVLQEIQNIISAQIRAQSVSSSSGILGGLLKGAAGFLGFGSSAGSSVQSVSNPNIGGTSYLLPTFARGGITSGPSIAGEAGQPEAVVPLPDGRSIPVNFNGGSSSGVKIDYVDMRGASADAVAALHQMITDLRADVPVIAQGAVQDRFNRSPEYMR